MPDIEIHGVKNEYFTERLREQIKRAFAGADYRAHLTIVTMENVVMDIDGNGQFFLRIAGTQKGLDAYLADMKERLKPLHVGIEVLLLAEYIPRSI